MLSKQAVMDYQKIYKQTFGEEISYEEAERQGIRLLRLFRIIYRPIPKGWPSQIQKGGEQ
jgi:hypothetical protein